MTTNTHAKKTHTKSNTNIFARNVLEPGDAQNAADLMQLNLATLIDLALDLKQAHWNVVGSNFRSFHIQLDEIIATVRDASDEVAERIVTIGHVPDGRSQTVREDSMLDQFPGGFHKVPEMLGEVADRLKSAVDQLRIAIDKMGEVDPISEDLLIGIAARLEKHLWMVQAQEV